jgi:hypothetical protein
MRLVTGLGALLAGGMTGLATVAVHRWWWGLLLAAAAIVAMLAAVGPGWLTRLPFGIGLALVVGRLAVRTSEGDYLLASDPAGYAVLGLALLTVAVAVVTLPRRR